MLTKDYWRDLRDARKMATARAGDVAKGINPLIERRTRAAAIVQEREAERLKVEGTLQAVAERYLIAQCGLVRDAAGAEGKATFDAIKSKIRSGHERIKFFEWHVYKSMKLAGRQIGDIKRSEITALLDGIEKTRGPQAAHKGLAFLSALFSWYAARTDDFRSPIVRGMGRIRTNERAGKRVLNDQEIRDVWTVCEKAEREKIKNLPPCFTRLVRVLLLTGVRLREAGRASWPEHEYLNRNDYQGDVLTIPGARMKGKLDHAVPLTSRVFALFGRRPADVKACPFVFSTTKGRRPFGDYGKAKAALDDEVAKLRRVEGRQEQPMPPWQLSRDIRRTVRTLLPRAGVLPNISERVLAHKFKGVVEVPYHRYGYMPEKRDALAKLDAIVDRILKTIDW